jgi:hypothetical protein
MSGETDLSVVSYYAIAIPRAFWAGWSWTIGQGLLLTSLLVAGGIAFEFLRFLRRRRVRAVAMSDFRQYARETAIAFVGGLVLVLFFLFIVFFVQDAPRQLNGWQNAWENQATEDQQTIVKLQSEAGCHLYLRR